MIVVTGGAGFIGSAIVYELNCRGISDIFIVDHINHPEKEKNLEGLKFANFSDKHTFLKNIIQHNLPPIESIIHMGACSSTTETNEEYLRKNNFEYTIELALYAEQNNIRFIYASSAATYGNGTQGYEDDESKIETLKPLNLYGKSKHQFDLWARQHNLFKNIVGLKFFNVYGPNEYHKGDMQSLVRKGFLQIGKTSQLQLFRSHKPRYQHGEQVRDFIYIKDAVAITLYFVDHQKIGGLFNVGAGVPRTWNDLAEALFHSMGKETNIEYIDIPESIRNQYQYHTCAEMTKLYNAGFKNPVTSLEEGIRDYVKTYLLSGNRLSK